MRLSHSRAVLLLIGCVPASALAGGDFNGDGFADLAIGAPFEDVGAVTNAGIVQILYGTAGGVDSATQQTLDAVGLGALAAEINERLGSTLAVGNFDGDDYDDLAIGVPGRPLTSGEAGAVVVVYGSAAGLDLASAEEWSQASPGIADQPGISEAFGQALAAGDFDGDGRDDLAIGVREAIAGHDGAGAVHVIYGTPNGLKKNGAQFWHQNRAGVLDQAELDDDFGSALAAGDFDGNGKDDLAIGVDGELKAGGFDGAVAVFYGRSSGLSATGDQLIHVAATLGIEQHETRFGSALAAGDVDGDGRDELAIGAPLEAIGSDDAGVVHLFYGKKKGLSIASHRPLHQGIDDFPGSPYDGERFGQAVAFADFDQNGYDDLVIGAVRDEMDGFGPGGGSIYALYGSTDALGILSMQRWGQDNPTGIPGVEESGDWFGSSLATGDYDGDGHPDLAVSVENEDANAAVAAGAVNVLYGDAANGITDVGSQIWYQGLNGCAGVAEDDDAFGFSLGR